VRDASAHLARYWPPGRCRPMMPTAEATLPFPRAGRFAGYLIRREPQAADAMPWFTAPGGAG